MVHPEAVLAAFFLSLAHAFDRLGVTPEEAEEASLWAGLHHPQAPPEELKDLMVFRIQQRRLQERLLRGALAQTGGSGPAPNG
jgi:hypothetical protein